MSKDELLSAHHKAAMEIMAEPSAAETGEPLERADRLEVALRHMICCWVLKEATFGQLAALTEQASNCVARYKSPDYLKHQKFFHSTIIPNETKP